MNWRRINSALPLQRIRLPNITYCGFRDHRNLRWMGELNRENASVKFQKGIPVVVDLPTPYKISDSIPLLVLAGNVLGEVIVHRVVHCKYAITREIMSGGVFFVGSFLA